MLEFAAFTILRRNRITTPDMSALIKSTLSVGSMTLLSRVLGLLRDIVIARLFSASDAADAFFVAFKIPNFLRRLFAEGAFSLAFVPVLSEYRSRDNMAQTRDLIDRVAGTLGFILLLLSLLGVFASPLIIAVFAAGFTDQPAKFELTSDMLRLTFPYILLISMTAMAGGILNTWKRFAVPAFTPVLLNLSMIGCALWLSPRLDVPITGLAWGVLIAGIAQLLFQLPFLYRAGLLPRPKWGWRHEGVQKIIKLMIPALFGSSVAQINLLFDTFIASFLVTGSVAWLYYSDRLLEFPLGVFGIALATVVCPTCRRRITGRRRQLQQDADLGHSTHPDHCTTGDHRPVPAGATDTLHPVRIRRVPAQRFDDVGLQPDGLQPRAARLHPHQDPGEWLLRAPGHQNPGAHRYPVDGDQHGTQCDIRGVDAAGGIHCAARRAGARHHRVGLLQCLAPGARVAS